MGCVAGVGLGCGWGGLRGKAGCYLKVGKSRRKSGRDDNAREVGVVDGVGGAGTGRGWGGLVGRIGCYLTLQQGQRKSGRNDNAL